MFSHWPENFSFVAKPQEGANPTIIAEPVEVGQKRPTLSRVFVRGKNGKGSDFELPSRSEEGSTLNSQRDDKPQPKRKTAHRKNITDGLIRLNVAKSDFTPTDYNIEYQDNPFEILEHNPARVNTFIENIRRGNFSAVNHRDIKRFVNKQQNQNEDFSAMRVENLELELLEVSRSYDSMLAKFFRFFQGLLPGFCIIHLFLIFAGASDKTILESFVLSAVRIHQIFFVVSLISTVGAFNRFWETFSQYNQPTLELFMKNKLRNQLIKYVIASISFLVVYGIIIYNHEFVSLISDKGADIKINDFQTKLSTFRVLSSIMTAVITKASVIGWLSLILAFEEIGKSRSEQVKYSNLLDEEPSEESIYISS